MLLRKWTTSDSPAVAELEKICFKYPWSAEMVEETASGDNFCGYVAVAGDSSDESSREISENPASKPDSGYASVEKSFDGQKGEIVGYAGAVFASDVADIALVAVSPSHVRKGYAFGLVVALCEELFSRGVAFVYLEVRKSNFAAIKLYDKCGFKPVGIRKRYYEDAEDAMVMMKTEKQ